MEEVQMEDVRVGGCPRWKMTQMDEVRMEPVQREHDWMGNVQMEDVIVPFYMLDFVYEQNMPTYVPYTI